MIFHETGLLGAYLIEMERASDERGFFARTYCRHAFEERGLNTSIEQCSISYNARKGTLRGMHYQVEPAAEVKLVQCICGSLYDVIIDLRVGSKTFCQWYAVELSDNNRLILYVPEGFAHGFQTLVDNTTVFYQISTFYAPQHARGVRWNDPAFAIEWPIKDPILSEKDICMPDFSQWKK